MSDEELTEALARVEREHTFVGQSMDNPQARCTCGVEFRWPYGWAQFATHRAEVLAAFVRTREAEQWLAGYEKGNLDGYFGTTDERGKSPYADLDPYREQGGPR